MVRGGDMFSGGGGGGGGKFAGGGGGGGRLPGGGGGKFPGGGGGGGGGNPPIDGGGGNLFATFIVFPPLFPNCCSSKVLALLKFFGSPLGYYFGTSTVGSGSPLCAKKAYSLALFALNPLEWTTGSDCGGVVAVGDYYSYSPPICFFRRLMAASSSLLIIFNNPMKNNITNLASL